MKIDWRHNLIRSVAGLPVGAWLSPRLHSIIICMIGVLLAFCWMGRISAPIVPAAADMRGPLVNTPARIEPPPVADAWTGAPPPAPGNYTRGTRKYQAWKERFTAALAILEGRKQAAEVKGLRDWLAAFEANAARRAEVTGNSGKMPVSPLFTRRNVRRVIGPPPSLAFERYYGYKVVLPWNKSVYAYEANAVPLDSPYLLHENGIKDGGTPVRQLADIHMLFARAGVTDPMAKNVLIKVSGREGGFDAVNTWDTGYVSVGFIQFTTGETGAGHSLLHVLQRMKTDEARLAKRRGHIDEFAHYFTDHGIDVQNGQLYVRDPATGETRCGAEAVRAIIDDKRVTAIFQDAGVRSTAFKLAQIREAYGAYYLADAPFRLPAAEICTYEVTAPVEPAGTAPEEQAGAGGDEPQVPAEPRLLSRRCVYGQQAVTNALAGTLSPESFAEKARQAPPGTVLRVARRLPGLAGAYGDVLDTEGGQVTLTDRAVQHGVRATMDYFAVCVNGLAPDHPLTLEELRQARRELIAGLKNRIDVPAHRAPTARPEDILPEADNAPL